MNEDSPAARYDECRAASQPGDNFAVLAVPNETPNPRQPDSLRVFVMARLCRSVPVRL